MSKGTVDNGQTEPSKSPLLSKSTEGATFLILLQIGSRLLTFSANQLLLRYLSPELLGISSQLEIYSISVLFFSREALRVAIQRQKDDFIKEKPNDDSRKVEGSASQGWKVQEVVNLAYISLALGIVLSTALGYAYFRSQSSNTAIIDLPYFRESLILYAIATCIELLSEPFFMLVQVRSDYKTRAVAESIAALSRCVAICGLVMFSARHDYDTGVLSFGLGQVVFSLSLLFVYCLRLWRPGVDEGFSLQIRKLDGGDYVLSYFRRSLLTLGTSLFVQGIVKHILTQGDSILVSYLASLEAQGIYALAANYGGLIARMVFQPIEESSRNYFGKLLSSVDGKPAKSVIDSASRDLSNLLRFYVLVSIVAAAIGPSVAPLLLNLVAGSRWSSAGAGDVLAQYCYYIPILAVNGATEAFISAVASKSELNGQSGWMFLFSLGFAVAGYVFLKIFDTGAQGLVWANMIGMALRIVWSFVFIERYFKRNNGHFDFAPLLPKPPTIAAGLGTAAILSQVRSTFTGGLADFGKAGFVSIGFLPIL